MTVTPQGAAARRWAVSAASACVGIGARRDPQVQPGARARHDGGGRADHRRAVDAQDGERRARPEHVRDGAGAEQRRRRRSTLASLRNCSGSGTAPRSTSGVLSRPCDRGLALGVAQRRQDRGPGPPARPGPAPPNMPECSSPGSASTCTTTLTMPRRLTVTAGTPTAALPVSQTRIASARSRSALLRHEVLEPAGALLLGALDDQLEVDRDVRRRGRAARSGASGCCPCSRRRRGRTSGRRPRSARTAGSARRRRRAAAARRSARRAARSARPGPGPGRLPTTALLPSAVSCRPMSVNPSSRNASTTHLAARAHSSGGNWRASATDLIATSSASSVADARHQRADALVAGRRRSLVHRVGVLEVADVALEVLELRRGSRP